MSNVSLENWDLSRDWIILAPVFAIFIALLVVILPNTEGMVSYAFTLSSGFVGLYGGIRGRGSSKSDISTKIASKNPLGLPSGLIRLVLGFFCLVIGIFLASAQRDQIYIMLMLGLGGEFIGISVPGIVNYFKNPSPT